MGKQIALHIDNNYQRRTHICRKLATLGLEVHKAATLETAENIVKTHRCRLVLIDIDTIGDQIFNFCSFVRSGSNGTIVVALMANAKVKIEEKLFDCGVNDVVTGMQTSAKVLTKRVQAHLNYCKSSRLSQSSTIRLKNVIVDFDRKEVWCNGTMRQLNGILADLLKYFIANPSRVISRDELLMSPIWADSICSTAEEGGKTFDVNIGKLRKIIEPNPQQPQIIETVRGKGWKLALDVI